jgi:hypothetical protein
MAFSKSPAGLRPAPSNALCPDAPRIKQISKFVVDKEPTAVKRTRRVRINLNDRLQLRRAFEILSSSQSCGLADAATPAMRTARLGVVVVFPKGGGGPARSPGNEGLGYRRPCGLFHRGAGFRVRPCGWCQGPTTDASGKAIGAAVAGDLLRDRIIEEAVLQATDDRSLVLRRGRPRLCR